MTLGSAIGVLLRRYWVLFVGLILTFGATAFVATQTPPRYEADASMILLLPADARSATEGAVSPFLYLPNSLQVLARIVISGPNSPEFQTQMAADGLTSGYELAVESDSPIISVTVEGRDPQNVMATRDRLIEGVQQELLTIQREEETPPRQTAHARVYASDAIPTRLESNRTRGMLVALGVGGVLTLLATFAIDRALQSLAERRRRLEEMSLGWDTPDDAVEPEVTPDPPADARAPEVHADAAADARADTADARAPETEPEVVPTAQPAVTTGGQATAGPANDPASTAGSGDAEDEGEAGADVENEATPSGDAEGEAGPSQVSPPPVDVDAGPAPAAQRPEVEAGEATISQPAVDEVGSTQSGPEQTDGPAPTDATVERTDGAPSASEPDHRENGNGHHGHGSHAVTGDPDGEFSEYQRA